MNYYPFLLEVFKHYSPPTLVFMLPISDPTTLTVETVDQLSNWNLTSLIRLWINSSRVWMSRDSTVPDSLSDCANVRVFWRAAIWAWSWLLSCLNASCSRMAFSWSRAAYLRSRSDWACRSFICSFMLASIWRSWFSYCWVGAWALAAAPWGEEPVPLKICDWSIAAGGRTVPLIALNGLALWRGAVKGNDLLSWSQQRCGRGFWRGFVRKILSWIGKRS